MKIILELTNEEFSALKDCVKNSLNIHEEYLECLRCYSVTRLDAQRDVDVRRRLMKELDSI